MNSFYFGKLRIHAVLNKLLIVPLQSSVQAPRAAQLLVSSILLLTSTIELRAFELSIVESGPEAEVSVWIRGLKKSLFRTSQLTSPAGEVFDSDSILESGIFNDLVRRFDTLEDAIEYLQGTWHATLESTISDRTDTYEFSINDISIEEFNRATPTLMSPNPGDVMKNGSTFLFGWDYPESGEMPSQSRFLTIPQFDPLRGGSLSIVSTPRPDSTSMSSGSSGTGNKRFSSKRTNVPGTDKNRFLYTLETSQAALPLDVEITLGSHISLDDKISFGETSGEFSPSFLQPRVRLFYSRQNDPFTITLSAVPEPASIGLVVAMVMSCMLSRIGLVTHQ